MKRPHKQGNQHATVRIPAQAAMLTDSNLSNTRTHFKDLRWGCWIIDRMPPADDRNAHAEPQGMLKQVGVADDTDDNPGFIQIWDSCVSGTMDCTLNFSTTCHERAGVGKVGVPSKTTLVAPHSMGPYLQQRQTRMSSRATEPSQTT